MTQAKKAALFQELHQRPRAFLIPNPWDAGSARILTGLGFEALATSSAASAGAVGRRDGQLTRDETLDHARAVVSATHLPVSADLMNGFIDAPDGVAQTVLLAAETGLVGCSIEDSTGETTRPIYDFTLAVERIQAAAEAAHSLPFPFTLTGRAENFVQGRFDLEDTIRRLVAYEKAGADVLFAPGLPDLAAIRAVCASVTKPVNVVIGLAGKSFTVADLEAAGVKRISVGASFYRAAMTALIDAAVEAKERGCFVYLKNTLPSSEISKHFPP